MSNALITAVDSMQNDMRLMETLSQNMVNISTPGYRRVQPAAPAFAQALAAAQPGAAARLTSSAVPTPPLASVDLTHGAVKPTGRDWDLAIDGDGYFELATPNGLAYTRAGDFALDARGRLVSTAGFPVQGVQGDIVLDGPAATVGRDGRITQDGREVAQLRIVRFADAKALHPGAAGALQPLAGAVGEQDTRSQLLTGHLEASNVAPMREMVALMQTTRHFEAAQKLYQGYDEMLGNAIQKLGQF
ncbi:flagellar hook-basal body protein [Massilia sp. S19_KUP03_FR1]|uniref:flagellar hook-basal body protein n=1 Tax=Massilia sp. S19_KUP03_FR1 TaxID=3025503 RepID=UPI002FCD6BB1